MLPVVIIVIAVLLLVAVLVVVRRPRQDEGMSRFRRHIDALSPEARREVHERAKRHEDKRNEDRRRAQDGDV